MPRHSPRTARCSSFAARSLLFGRVGVYAPLADNEQLDEKIRKQVADACSEGVKTMFELVTGGSRHAADVIADVARETGADLVVVGSHGYSAVAGLLLGSVTQQLLHRAPCPVLAIPPMKQAVTSEAFERELAGGRSVAAPSRMPGREHRASGVLSVSYGKAGPRSSAPASAGSVVSLRLLLHPLEPGVVVRKLL